MCGRYSVALPETALDIASVFDAVIKDAFTPRYNLAPSQSAPVVRLDVSAAREVVGLHWGLIPFFARDKKVGFSNINARAETVASKPAFREAFARRRCLVPATGYYEWLQTGPKTKQPFHIKTTDAAVFAMAGIWERWKAQDGGVLESYAIITTNAAASVTKIHDRMPVILQPEAWPLWLDPDASADRLQRVLAPYPSGLLNAYPVHTRVGSYRNDDAECVVPIAVNSA